MVNLVQCDKHSGRFGIAERLATKATNTLSILIINGDRMLILIDVGVGGEILNNVFKFASGLTINIDISVEDRLRRDLG